MHLNETNLDKKDIINVFDLPQSALYDISKPEPEPIDQEEVSGLDVDMLTAILCDGEEDILKYYSKFVNAWCIPDDEYEIILSNGEDDNELTLSTELDNDTVVISREDHFTSIDLFNILRAINSQVQFYDLFVLLQNDSDTRGYSGTVYSSECFSIHKDWAGDLIELFREGKFDSFSSVQITSDFDELGLEPAEGDVRSNRLYVMFTLNY